MAEKQIFISCKEAAKLISREMDQPLSLGQKVNLWIHLKMCAFCVRAQRQLQALHKLFGFYRDFEETEPPFSEECLPPEVRKRMQVSLQEHNH